MGRISKLITMPPGLRWLLTKATILLTIVRLALALLPFRLARRLISRASRPSPRLAAGTITVGQIAWAVETAARIAPAGHHCLSKAVTAQVLLMRRGHHAEIRYGAARQPRNEFVAHAWVECEGRIVVGGHDLSGYATLNPRTNSPD